LQQFIAVLFLFLKNHRIGDLFCDFRDFRDFVSGNASLKPTWVIVPLHGKNIGLILLI
jgi:hypothetical protein